MWTLLWRYKLPPLPSAWHMSLTRLAFSSLAVLEEIKCGPRKQSLSDQRAENSLTAEEQSCVSSRCDQRLADLIIRRKQMSHILGYIWELGAWNSCLMS